MVKAVIPEKRQTPNSRKSLFHFHHSVSNSNVSLNILRGIGFFFQLFSQCCHKDTQGSNIILPTASPYTLRYKGMSKHLADVFLKADRGACIQ